MGFSNILFLAPTEDTLVNNSSYRISLLFPINKIYSNNNNKISFYI